MLNFLNALMFQNNKYFHVSGLKFKVSCFSSHKAITSYTSKINILKNLSPIILIKIYYNSANLASALRALRLDC